MPKGLIHQKIMVVFNKSIAREKFQSILSKQLLFQNVFKIKHLCLLCKCKYIHSSFTCLTGRHNRGVYGSTQTCGIVPKLYRTS